MNELTSARKAESTEHSLRIKVLLEKLRSKLKNFTVLDSGGLVMGKVQEVYLDPSRQLNLVISDADNYSNSRLFLLRSTHIQQVDYSNKLLRVDIDKSVINELPEYKLSPSSKVDLSQSIGVATATARSPEPSAVEAGGSVTSNLTQLPETQVEDSNNGYLESPEERDVVEEEMFRLLEERLVVDVTKQKVGEVIVRKEIETHIIEVPVRREKLIVEQISPERKQLAEIDLGQEQISVSGIEIEQPQLEATKSNDRQTVKGEFTSPKTASLLLDAIAKQKNHGCHKVRIEIVMENGEHQQTFQEWFDRCSGT